jgi:hypothetical protein
MLRPGGLLRPSIMRFARGEGPGSKTLQDRNKALESLSRVQGRGEGRFRWFSPVNNLRFLSICEAAFRLGKKQPNWRQASSGRYPWYGQPTRVTLTTALTSISSPVIGERTSCASASGSVSALRCIVTDRMSVPSALTGDAAYCTLGGAIGPWIRDCHSRSWVICFILGFASWSGAGA